MEGRQSELTNESKEDLFISRFIFVQALSAIIPEGKGVLLVFENEEFGLRRVIVHNTDEIIGVVNATERTDLNHGDWVTMIDEDLIKN